MSSSIPFAAWAGMQSPLRRRVSKVRFVGVSTNSTGQAHTSTLATRFPVPPSLTRALSVIAIDNSPTRLALARHNAQIYGVADRIEFILGDFVQFAQSYKTRRSPPIDVVFLSPPWGGISYLSASPSKQASLAALASDEFEQQHPDYPLSLLQPLPGTELFALARAITPHVALFLPRNSDLQDISALVADEPDGTNLVEVEEEWMGNKLKALTCYFGGLAAGQEQLFS